MRRQSRWRRRTTWTGRLVSKRLAGPPGPAAELSRPGIQLGVRVEQTIEVALELTPAQDSRIQAVDPGPADRAADDEAVSLERTQRLLYPRQIHVENTRQFARVALDEQLEPEKRSRPSLTAEWAGRDLDRHWRSYDHHRGS